MAVGFVLITTRAGFERQVRDALDAIARVDNEWAFDLCPQNER